MIRFEVDDEAEGEDQYKAEWATEWKERIRKATVEYQNNEDQLGYGMLLYMRSIIRREYWETTDMAVILRAGAIVRWIDRITPSKFKFSGVQDNIMGIPQITLNVKDDLL